MSVANDRQITENSLYRWDVRGRWLKERHESVLSDCG